ncbi:MAG: SiaB family protein kinase [Burkholderiaceae bacterium]|nr:SiaB family protein kinase [Roseateles sp.]MBV8471743.1 SiaB family protein kinase [Burkholderiaceae bacterium]
MATSPIISEYGAFFELARKHRVIFYYVGYFSQNIIAAMAEAVKLQLEISGVTGPDRRKLFSSFVEMAQNIIHYSVDALTPPSLRNGELRHGSVCIIEHQGRHLLLCANPIETSVAEDLRVKLETLHGMSTEEIKQAYKDLLRSETPEGSKGAGIGFLTMARDASEPLAFDIQLADGIENTAVFYLMTTI